MTSGNIIFALDAKFLPLQTPLTVRHHYVYIRRKLPSEYTQDSETRECAGDTVWMFLGKQ